MIFETVTARDRPDLDDEAGDAFRERWPEFIFHDPVPPKVMPRIQAYFPMFDILLLDAGKVAAGGWGIPFHLDDGDTDVPEGYDAASVRAVDDREANRVPNAFSFMAAAVHPAHDKRGLAQQVLRVLSDRARDAGIERIFAPIRPTWKHRYPQVPMDRYATWTRSDGLSIDPWIRTHQRMGARIVRTAGNSMVIPGSVAEWERWADMPFPESGDYVVPDALNLVRVDLDADLVIYREENLWMEHPTIARPQ